mmetsp:Transcript_39800/g.48485  ORF Transcript_39800/g.48485 Transcript_39800/m.48485 type:complete len:686 (+) Transcript_39800:61-2118(+)
MSKSENDMQPQLERTLRGHRGPVTCVAFSPDTYASGFASSLPTSNSSGKDQCQHHLLASSSLDGMLTLWNFSTKNSGITHKTDLSSGVNDKKKSAAGSKSNSSGSGRGDVRAYRFLGHTAPIHHVTFSPSGNLLASCSSDRTVRLWVPNAQGDSVILKGHGGPVRCVDFSRAAAAAGDQRQQQPSRASALLVTGSDDKTVKVWTLPHKKFKCSLVGHSNWVRCCRFSPDTPYLVASGGDDRIVRLWDVERGSELTSYSDLLSCSSSSGSRATAASAMSSGGGVNRVEFHTSGTALASGAMDGSIRIYDIRSDVLIQHYPRAITSGGSTADEVSLAALGITSLSFHPSGNYLLSACASGTLKIWDIRERRLLHSVKKSCHNVAASSGKTSFCAGGATFSSDGTFLASSGTGGDDVNSDRNVMVWKSNLRSFVGSGSCANFGKAVGASSNRSPRRAGRETGGNNTNKNHCPRSVSPGISKDKKQHAKSDNPKREYVIEDLAGEDVIHYPADEILQNHTTANNQNNQCANSPHLAPASSEKQQSRATRHNTSSTSSSVPYDRERLPEILVGTLDHIVGQLDMLTRTVAMIDKRLSIQEDVMAQVLAERAEESLRLDQERAARLLQEMNIQGQQQISIDVDGQLKNGIQNATNHVSFSFDGRNFMSDDATSCDDGACTSEGGSNNDLSK